MQSMSISGTERSSFHRYRSFFWPLLLIVLGVVLLLQNAGILNGATISIFVRLWPLALIIVGVELLLAPRQPRLAAIISIGTLGVALAIAVIGPVFGLGKVDV